MVPGDEGVSRLVLAVAPDSTVASSSTTLTPLAPGIAITPLPAGSNVAYTVRDASGRQVFDGSTGAGGAAQPSNLVAWESRGDYDLVVDEDVRQAYATAVGTEPELESYHYKPLYTGDTDSGVRFTIGQAWASGDTKAHTFGYATGGTNGPQVYLGPLTPDDAQLVALLVDNLPGTTTDLLVLVPRPGTGPLGYSPDATSAFRNVANGRSDLNGIGLVDRSTRATDDRIEQLDGDGMKLIYRGPVAPYLCGSKECG